MVEGKQRRDKGLRRFGIAESGDVDTHGFGDVAELGFITNGVELHHVGQQDGIGNAVGNAILAAERIGQRMHRGGA